MNCSSKKGKIVFGALSEKSMTQALQRRQVSLTRNRCWISGVAGV